MKRVHKAAATVGWIAIIAGQSAAQLAFDRIDWEGTGWPVIVSVVGGFLAALLIFYSFYVYKRLRAGADEAAVMEKRFAEAVQRVGLSPAEIAKVRKMALHDTSVQPQVLLQSVAVFEKCLDREVQECIKSSRNPQSWKEENELLAGLRRKCGFLHLPHEHPLMSTRNIELGQGGSLFGADLKTPLLQRAVLKECSEFTFSLYYDTAKEDVVRIAANQGVKFVFSRLNDGLYGVPLQVVRAEGDGVIEVYHSVDMRRNQLRQFVRIEVNLPLKLRLIRTTDPDSSQIAPGAVMEARMADISGGGLSFLSDRSLRPGDLIAANFSLPDCNFTTISCKVLRISLQEGKTKTHYRHHAQFVNLETARRDAIVRFVFEKLRLLSQWS